MSSVVESVNPHMLQEIKPRLPVHKTPEQMRREQQQKQIAGRNHLFRRTISIPPNGSDLTTYEIKQINSQDVYQNARTSIHPSRVHASHVHHTPSFWDTFNCCNGLTARNPNSAW